MHQEHERLRSGELAAVLRSIADQMDGTAAADQLLTTRDTAEKLGVSCSTLRRYENGGLLIPVRFGGKVMYRRGDVDEFIHQHTA